MNATIKAIVQQRSLDPERVAALISLFGGDEDHVQQILLSRAKSHDDQHLKVAYKAADDGGDVEIPPEVDDALVALYESLGNDWGAVIARLSAPVAETKRIDVAYPPAGSNGLLGQTKKAIEVPRAMEQPMIDAYRMVGNNWHAVKALLAMTAKTYQAATKQAQQEQARYEMTATKAARTDPMSAAFMGDLTSDMIPR